MELKRPSSPSDESGQAVIEYILMLSVVVSIFVALMKVMSAMGAQQKLMSPITVQFAAAYQFGHPKAKGFDNGGPAFHPRVSGGENNFRLFLNPH